MAIQRKRVFAAFVGALSAVALLSACGDELTEVANSGTQQVATYEDLVDCNKSNEGSLAYIKDSDAVYLCADGVWKEMYTIESDEEDGKNGANGTSCSVSSIKDGSGYDVLCGGKKVGQLLSAEDGEKGRKGPIGDKGADGTDCTATALKDGSGFELSCDDKVVGTIENGKNGKKGADGASCSAKSLDDGSGFEISCGGEVVGTLKNGESHTGAGCTFEDDGEGLITTKCGSDTKGVKLYKAVCLMTPYDPDEYACSSIEDKNDNLIPVLIPLCDGVLYNPEDPDLEDNFVASLLSSDSKQICKDGVVYEICGDVEYKEKTQFCVDNKVYDRCGGFRYSLEQFSSCKDGVIYQKCGDGEYNTVTEVCKNGKVLRKCGNRGDEYDPEKQVCDENGNVLPKCGKDGYDPVTHFCGANNQITELCGTDYKDYDIEKEVCIDGSVLPKCGEDGYDPTTHFCGANNQITKRCGTDNKDYDIEKEVCKDGSVLPKCGEDGYDPTTHFCGANNQITERCGTEHKDYDIEKEVCKDGYILSKCGEDGYDPTTHFCGANNQITERCGTEHKDYDIVTQMCKNEKVESKTKCDNGDEYYDPETQICDENGMVLTQCGSTYFDSKEKKCVNGDVNDRTYCGNKEYDNQTQFCDTRNGHSYKRIHLYSSGKKTRIEVYWMAEDLDYNIEDGSVLVNHKRYYSWDAAQIACPTGWHLPTKAEVEDLIGHTGGIDNAGKNLKSVDGWSKTSLVKTETGNQVVDDGKESLDRYGFGATPNSYYEGTELAERFLGEFGVYVSSTEEDDSVYALELHNNSDAAEVKLWPKKDKDGYFMKYTVRCVLRVKQ